MIIESKMDKIPFGEVKSNDVFKYEDFFYLKTDTIEDYNDSFNCWNLNEKHFDCFGDFDMVALYPEAKLII